ncbi:MAG: MCE family protein [Chloroflexi bacterium]|nr:MAG: MCE family protein [Chloroflexota bacterium]
MRPRQLGLTVVGSVLGAALLATGFVVSKNGLVGTWDYHVKVRVADADGLIEGNRVAVAGVPAGRILDLQIADHSAILTLGITTDVRPLLSDTTTSIRPKGLAGERFIELVPGTKGAPVADYGTLSSATVNPVEVEDVLNAFDAPTRAGLQSFLTDLGAGMAPSSSPWSTRPRGSQPPCRGRTTTSGRCSATSMRSSTPSTPSRTPASSTGSPATPPPSPRRSPPATPSCATCCRDWGPFSESSRAPSAATRASSATSLCASPRWRRSCRGCSGPPIPPSPPSSRACRASSGCSSSSPTGPGVRSRRATGWWSRTPARCRR